MRPASPANVKKIPDKRSHKPNSPFAKGTAVVIAGVEEGSGAYDLNGLTATVVSYESENDRYVLKIDSTGKGKAVKSEYVKLVEEPVQYVKAGDT